MPTLQTVAVICFKCRKGWRLKPEDACELREVAGLVWSQLRDLKCQDCGTKLSRMPGPGEPTVASYGSYWLVDPNLRWMS